MCPRAHPMGPKAEKLTPCRPEISPPAGPKTTKLSPGIGKPTSAGPKTAKSGPDVGKLIPTGPKSAYSGPEAGCFVYAGEGSGYVPESSSGMVWDDGAVCRNCAEGRQWQNWAVSRDRAAGQEGAVVRRDWVAGREGQQWRCAGNGRYARAAWRRCAGNGWSAGVAAGYLGSRIGARVAIRSNFSFHRPAYSTLSDGNMDGGYFWAGGRSAVGRLFITAGPMLRIKNRLSVFACMGYGERNLFWEDFQGKWAEVADASHHGVCAEAGTEWQFSRCFAGASLIWMPGSHCGAGVSVGWCF